MSDVVRNYSGSARKGLQPGRRRRRGPLRWLVRLLFLALFAGVGAAWWISRDSIETAHVVPATQELSVVFNDLVANRARLAGSGVWDLLPAESGAQEIRAALREDFGLPPWILNNIIGKTCYVSANDIERFGDALAITKMTRVGCLAERASRLAHFSTQDEAGGLRLRHLADPDLYYAVRGRLLLVSPSRDALIEALTLEGERAMDPALVQEWTERAGSEDLRGRILLDESDRLSASFRSLAFALRFETQEARAEFRARLSPQWEERLQPLFSGQSPKALLEPPPGALAVSADFGRPLRVVLPALGDAFQLAFLNSALWAAWEQAPEDAPPGLAYTLTQLLGPTGPAIRAAIQGIDLDEILPTPLLVYEADSGAVDPASWWAGQEAAVSDAPLWESVPRYNAETGILHVPMIGGRSLEPSLARSGTTLVASNSADVLAALLADPNRARAPLTRQGNLFLRAQPRECIQLLADTGRFLAEYQLLRGMDAAAFDERVAIWMASVAHLDALTVLVGLEEGALRFNLTLSTQ